jgi:hypothetical protein
LFFPFDFKYLINLNPKGYNSDMQKDNREAAWKRFARWEHTHISTPDDALHLIGEVVDLYLSMHKPSDWTKESVKGIQKMREVLAHIGKAA